MITDTFECRVPLNDSCDPRVKERWMQKHIKGADIGS